jgi:hypothetical protein
MHIDNTMKFTMLCMRTYSTAGHAPMIQASEADANGRVLVVNAPLLSTPGMFKVIDMVYKNSVLAEDNESARTRSHSAMTEYRHGIFMPRETRA